MEFPRGMSKKWHACGYTTCLFETKSALFFSILWLSTHPDSQVGVFFYRETSNRALKLAPTMIDLPATLTTSNLPSAMSL